MKQILLFVGLALTSVQAQEGTEYYVSLASNKKPDGKVVLVPTAGKRVSDAKTVVDTQFYAKEEGVEEYEYRFDLTKNALTILAEGKPTGHGTYQVTKRGETSDWKYEYEVKGKDGYAAQGTDTFAKDAKVLYSEDSSYKLPGQANLETWQAKYYRISAAEYEGLAIEKKQAPALREKITSLVKSHSK